MHHHASFQGKIEDFAKFRFASLAENGELRKLPEWMDSLQLSDENDPEIKIIIAGNIF